MLRGAVSWEGLFKLILSFLSLVICLFSGSGYGYLNVGRGVFYQRRSHLKWLFSLFFLSFPTFLQVKIGVVMGKRFSSFVGLNFGVWVSFEKMGHTGFGGGGVDVRTKNVGIWLWGWVLFLSFH